MTLLEGGKLRFGLRMVGVSCAVLVLLTIFESFALGGESAGPSAVSRLSSAPPAPASPDLYDGWNDHIQARLQTEIQLPAHSEAGSTAASAAEGLPTEWFILGGGVLVGLAIIVFLLKGVFSSQNPKVQGNKRQARQESGNGIELISSETLEDQGSILVVEVHGERLVLGVSGNRDYVTLLTKLGQHDAMPTPSEAIAFATRLAGRSEEPAPARVSVEPDDALTSALPDDELPEPDEDLEELLDELLGKVRGLKPLAKRADES